MGTEYRINDYIDPENDSVNDRGRINDLFDELGVNNPAILDKDLGNPEAYKLEMEIKLHPDEKAIYDKALLHNDDVLAVATFTLKYMGEEIEETTGNYRTNPYDVFRPTELLEESSSNSSSNRSEDKIEAN